MDEILADSSDEEELEEAEVKERGKDKKKRGKGLGGTWISEGKEGIVDLLSPGAAQAVSSTHPKAKKSVAEPKKKSEDFKIGADGRLVIVESDDDEKTQKRVGPNLMDEDEEEETFEKLVSGKKRKRGASEARATIEDAQSRCSQRLP